jgi:hypothetical protein
VRKISHLDVEVVKFKNGNLKDQAHQFFDKIWRFGYISRDEAYQHLASWLGVAEPEAHMSVMDNKRCKEVIEFSVQRLNDLRRLDLDWGDEIKHPYYELLNKK